MIYAQETAYIEAVQPSASAPTAWVEAAAAAVEEQRIEFRRLSHQHPELGNQEVETAAYVAKHLEVSGLRSTLALPRPVSSAS